MCICDGEAGWRCDELLDELDGWRVVDTNLVFFVYVHTIHVYIIINIFLSFVIVKVFFGLFLFFLLI